MSELQNFQNEFEAIVTNPETSLPQPPKGIGLLGQAEFLQKEQFATVIIPKGDQV